MGIAVPRGQVSPERLATLLATGALGLILIGFGMQRLVARATAPGDPAGRAGQHRLEASLAEAPADPAGWAKLAEIYLAESGPAGRAPRALVLSLMTGPNEPGLLWRRVELGLASWPSLDEGDQALMETQLRRAAKQDPARLAGLARGSGRAEAVQAALADEPEALERFNTRLGAH
jgi:hypothetical protein